MKKSNDYRLVPATENDTETILNLFNDLIDSYEGGINYPDWTKGVYPSYEYLERATENGELYKFVRGEEIFGAAVINTKANEDYRNVPWSIPGPEDKILILHSFFVKNMNQRQGIGHIIFDRIIELARELGMKSIHLDTIHGQCFKSFTYILKANAVARKLSTGEGTPAACTQLCSATPRRYDLWLCLCNSAGSGLIVQVVRIMTAF